MSRSPELLILKPLGEMVGSAGERIDEIVDTFDEGDSSTMARSLESSRSRCSFTHVNLE